MSDVGIANLKEKVTQNIFKLICADSPNTYIEEFHKLDTEISSILSSDEVVTELNISITVKLPVSRTKDMEKGINNRWINKFRSFFKETAGGSDKLSYEGDWDGEIVDSPDEKMKMVICDTPLSDWRDTATKLQKMLKQSQLELKQEAIYLKVGTEGQPINFLSDEILLSFPPQCNEHL